MNELPIYISIFSHIFFNPVLFFMVALSIEKLSNEDESIRMMKAAGDHAIAFKMLAFSYVIGSVMVYAMFMTVLFGALRLFGAVSGIDSFINTQFNYYSIWRMIIVAVMTVNIYLWAARRKIWVTTGLYLAPFLLTCTVAQIVLFFKHLY
jgi:hypothetical protein